MEIITKTKYLDFKKTPSPSGHDWCYVKRTNDTLKHDSAVVITTIIKKDGEYNFLFLKTNRPPLSAENKALYCIESPAGLIGDVDSGEMLLECAKKELLEEAGLVANKIYEELTNSSSSSGLSSETLSYVTAVVDDYNIVVKPISDGGIILERFLVKVSQIDKYFKDIDKKTYSVASATIAGVYFALNRLKVK